MSDYERLKKALTDLVEEASGHADGCWGSGGLECSVKGARRALAETPEASEMKRFKTRLWEAMYETTEDEHGSTWLSIPKMVLDGLWAEFGYGGEDGERD